LQVPLHITHFVRQKKEEQNTDLRGTTLHSCVAKACEYLLKWSEGGQVYQNTLAGKQCYEETHPHEYVHSLPKHGWRVQPAVPANRWTTAIMSKVGKKAAGLPAG